MIDCELRRPSQHCYNSLDNRLSLMEWLRSDSAIAEDLMADSQLGIPALGDSASISYSPPVVRPLIPGAFLKIRAFMN